MEALRFQPRTLLLGAIVAALLAQGCSTAHPASAGRAGARRSGTELLRRFFRENKPEDVVVSIQHLRPRESVPVPLEFDSGLESAILDVLRNDSRPVGCPSYSPDYLRVLDMDVHGPHYSLHITLTKAGFALGNDRQYLFVNRPLSEFLDRACQDNCLYSTLPSHYVSRIKYFLKTSAGEEAEFHFAGDRFRATFWD